MYGTEHWSQYYSTCHDKFNIDYIPAKSRQQIFEEWKPGNPAPAPAKISFPAPAKAIEVSTRPGKIWKKPRDLAGISITDF